MSNLNLRVCAFATVLGGSAMYILWEISKNKTKLDSILDENSSNTDVKDDEADSKHLIADSNDKTLSSVIYDDDNVTIKKPAEKENEQKKIAFKELDECSNDCTTNTNNNNVTSIKMGEVSNSAENIEFGAGKHLNAENNKKQRSSNTSNTTTTTTTYTTTPVKSTKNNNKTKKKEKEKQDEDIYPFSEADELRSWNMDKLIAMKEAHLNFGSMMSSPTTSTSSNDSANESSTTLNTEGRVVAVKRSRVDSVEYNHKRLERVDDGNMNGDKKKSNYDEIDHEYVDTVKKEIIDNMSASNDSKHHARVGNPAEIASLRAHILHEENMKGINQNTDMLPLDRDEMKKAKIKRSDSVDHTRKRFESTGSKCSIGSDAGVSMNHIVEEKIVQDALKPREVHGNSKVLVINPEEDAIIHGSTRSSSGSSDGGGVKKVNQNNNARNKHHRNDNSSKSPTKSPRRRKQPKKQSITGTTGTPTGITNSSASGESNSPSKRKRNRYRNKNKNKAKKEESAILS